MAGRIEHLERRQHAAQRAAGAGRQRRDPLQQLDERARQRQRRPGRVGGGVDQHQPALAALRAGDQRRAVGEPRPGRGGQLRPRLRQHLALHHDVALGHLRGRRAGRPRRSSRAAAAGPRTACRRDCDRRAAAGPAPVVVLGIGEPRAGKAQQHAAGLDPVRRAGRARPGRSARCRSARSPAPRPPAAPRSRRAAARRAAPARARRSTARTAAAARAWAAGSPTRPTSRRRQRSSSSTTPPTPRDGSSSSRAIWLRSSSGSSIRASARRRLGVERQPLAAPGPRPPARPRARIRLCSRAGRRPPRARPPAASSATSGGSSRIARCVARIGEHPERAELAAAPRRTRAASRARPGSSATPSLSQTSSAPLDRLALELRERGRAVDRPGLGQPARDGAAPRRRRSAAAASSRPDPAPCRAGSTSRLCRCARPAKRSSAAIRCSQPGAAAQPSSTTSTSGPSPDSSGSGLSTGPASARIRRVASTRRSTSSQGGVRAEVSSSGCRPSRKRIAGKRSSLRRRRDHPQQPPQHRQAEQRGQQPGIGQAEQAQIEHRLALPLGRERGVEREQRRLGRVIAAMAGEGPGRATGRGRADRPDGPRSRPR